MTVRHIAETLPKSIYQAEKSKKEVVSTSKSKWIGPIIPMTFLEAQPRMSAPAFGVGIALYRRADKQGKCFPSYERIAADTGFTSFSTISKALDELKALGFITITKTGRSNVYQLTHSNAP